MKKILFVVIEKGDEKINKATKESILKSSGDVIPHIQFAKVPEDFNDTYFNIIKNTSEDVEYVCVIPNGSMLADNFLSIFAEYEEEDKKTIYLPLALLNSEKMKGVLNTCVWKYSADSDFGMLGPDLAMKQIDTTLYGAIVPKSVYLEESNYDFGIKYYQHFRILNAVSQKEDYQIIGIPKLLFVLNYDLSFAEADEKEKIEHYLRAGSPWRSEEKQVITV